MGRRDRGQQRVPFTADGCTRYRLQYQSCILKGQVCITQIHTITAILVCYIYSCMQGTKKRKEQRTKHQSTQNHKSCALPKRQQLPSVMFCNQGRRRLAIYRQHRHQPLPPVTEQSNTPPKYYSKIQAREKERKQPHSHRPSGQRGGCVQQERFTNSKNWQQQLRSRYLVHQLPKNENATKPNVPCCES